MAGFYHPDHWPDDDDDGHDDVDVDHGGGEEKAGQGVPDHRGKGGICVKPSNPMSTEEARLKPMRLESLCCNVGFETALK